MISLEPGILTLENAYALGAMLRKEDRMECQTGDPKVTLLQSFFLGGDRWMCLNGDKPLGAFGYTDHGTIWSLWRELSRGEARAILQHTPLWVRQMVLASHRPFLYNHIHSTNKAALSWLRASKCFSISEDPIEVETMQDVHAYYFRTVPLSEMTS